MRKNLQWFFFLAFQMLSFAGFGQVTISGRIVEDVNHQPLAHANVFIENSSTGTETNNEGKFSLEKLRPGKYKLVVSMVGYENYKQALTVNKDNIALPDIQLTVKMNILKQVTITPQSDAQKETYFNWFKKQFLGTSDFAESCTILNPEVIDFDYDATQDILTATASDLIQIKNTALGYIIKYALNSFTLKEEGITGESVQFDGSAFFQSMTGSPGKQKTWDKNRRNAFEGSGMSFFRALIANDLNDNGFRVYRIVRPVDGRPSDEMIKKKIDFFTANSGQNPACKDSLKEWKSKGHLPKKQEEIDKTPLRADQLVKVTDQRNVFALSSDSDKLFLSYNGHQRYGDPTKAPPLNSYLNTDNTLVIFNSRYAFFTHDGMLVDPGSLTFSGVLGRKRMGDFLPADFSYSSDTALTSTKSDAFITSKLLLLAEHPQEQVYLHLNKPYFLLGESIYFKAYLTTGYQHNPSDLSRVLHADLISPQNKIVHSILLPVNNGTAWGDFYLPDTIPPGKYKIHGYTSYMRDMDSVKNGCGFYQEIMVFAPAMDDAGPDQHSGARAGKHTVSASPPRVGPMLYDLQFLPEGGQLLAGIRTKVAFKAIDTTGQGVGVNGVVLDNNDKQVAEYTSSRLGMGCFYLKPEAGKTYHARAKFAGKMSEDIPFPQTTAEGITLSAESDSAQIVVKVCANEPWFRKHKNENYTLVAFCGENTTSFQCELDSTVLEIDLQKNTFRSGMVQLTLLSPALGPLCERLIFVQNPSPNSLTLNNQQQYATGTPVSLTLHLADNNGQPVVNGQFSVSVNDANLVPVKEDGERTILTSLLLSGNLKGYIEDPNYYFTNVNRKKLEDLDLVMLTHGYRGFSWARASENGYARNPAKPEKTFVIAGSVTNAFNRPVKHGPVYLLSTDSTQRVLSSTTDSMGRFVFDNLVFKDSTAFIVNARGPKGGKVTKIKIDAPTAGVAPATDVYSKEMGLAVVPDSAVIRLYYQYFKFPAGTKTLKQIEIKDVRRDDDYQTASLAGAGHADQVLHSKDMHIEGALSLSLNGVLTGIIFYNVRGKTLAFEQGNHASMLVVVDGVEGSDITPLQTHEVETVEVLRFANASIYGQAGANGVLIVTTKRSIGIADDQAVPIGIASFYPPGFYKARTFYAPKYSRPIAEQAMALQTAIFWKPDLTTDEKGNALINYNNTGVPTTYRIVVEGYDSNGNLYHQVFSYLVK
jgi:hypothetical protein